ncbi:MAG: hypothetical protein J5584_03975 [Clostridia bacterium]|nr:hypothetical protein [Clostridia bacterium]
MKGNRSLIKWCALLCALLLPGLTACSAPGHGMPEVTRGSTSTPEPEAVPELKGAVDNARLRNKTVKNYTVHASPVLENFYNLYNMEVERCDDPEYPYRMWIFGESTGDRANPDTGYDSIFHGRGRDIDHWEMWCGEQNGIDIWDTTMDPALWQPVLRRADKNYDSVHNGDPSVVYKDGRFYMAFSSVGFDERDGRTYIINNIMGAVSDDGIHWTKSEAPLLIWDREYIEGWEAGTPCPPSTGGYHRPSLMWDNAENKWKLWFDYYLPGTFLSMGYAVNNGDFMQSSHWQVIHAEETPQLKDWPNPEVCRIGDKYYAFSDAPGYGVSRGGAQNDRQLVIAVSDNGWDWRVLGRFLPESKEWGTHLPQTFIDTAQGGETKLYLFYSMTDQENLPRYVKANYLVIDAAELLKLEGE